MAATSVITVVSALKVVSKWLDVAARAYHQGGSVTEKGCARKSKHSKERG